MRITHPQTAYQGMAPENVFFVSSDAQEALGSGFIIPFLQSELYPERPFHLYIQIDALPTARSLTFGALLGRAEQLRAENAMAPARLYTQVNPRNLEIGQFYQKCGLVNDDSEDLYTFPIPGDMGRAPMGMDFASAPLETEAAVRAFLERINAYRIQPLTQDELTYWRQQPHFLAVGFYRGGAPVAEALFSGAGQLATLHMLYTKAEYRRQGLAKQLLFLSAQFLRERGVANVHASVFRRNVPQMALMRRLNATPIGTVTLLPGLNL